MPETMQFRTGWGGGGGGGGQGPKIMKELMVIFSVWIVAKTWIKSNKPPPPKLNGPNTQMPIPRELYSYEKPRLIGHMR